MSDLDHEIEPNVDPDVARVLAEVGRTEDLRFSPDGRRIAIAGFARRTIVLVDVTVAEGVDGAPTVAVDGALVVTTDLAQPHGVDWLDGETLVVGDREGGVALVAAPAGGPGVGTADGAGTPLTVGSDLVRGPGSVAVVGGPDGAELLVCNNWADTVTRHRLGPRPTVLDEEVWLRRSLDLPDGVAVSADGRWVAVSNHNQQVVLVYARDEVVGPDQREPVGVLRGARYPHGLRFTPDGCHLLVADAGSPSVLVYEAAPDGWATAAYPVGVLRVLADDVFATGHRRPDEGGPKGVDIDPSGRVLALTTEHRTLGFVDLAAARRQLRPPVPAVRAAYERTVLARIAEDRADRERTRHEALAAEVREHDARALAGRTEEHARVVEDTAAAAAADAEDARRRAEAAEHRADDAEAHLAAIRATRLWRAAERPRRLYARLRERAARRP